MTTRSVGHPSRQIVAIASWSVVIVLLTLVAALVASPGSTVGGAAAAPGTQNVEDSWSRTVSQGLGSALRGGNWLVSPGPSYSIIDHRAELTGISARTPATAVLPSVVVSDERLLLTVAMSRLPQAGAGVWISEQFRTQSGQALRARLRVLPSGLLTLGFAEYRNGTDHAVGLIATLHRRLVPGQLVTLEADVSGTSSVDARARAWVEGTAEPSWQVRTQVDDGDIPSSGSVGFAAYVSPSSGESALSVTRFDGWSLPTDAPVTPSSTPTGSSPAPQHPSAGSATPGTATYAIPSSALYVSPSGRDSGSGTKADPLKTIAQAVAEARSGSTIVLRGGSYNQGAVVPAGTSLTIEGMPGEAVWLDGSIPVSGWARSGTSWVHNGWLSTFASTAGYSARSARNYNWINSRYPMAAHPDQVFEDGAPLAQVASAADVKQGTFFADYPDHRLVVGSNPTGHVLRASNLASALIVESSNSLLRGFGVRRYATPVPLLGTVRMTGAHDTVDDVVITDNASQGVSFGGPFGIANHVTATDNGLLGIHANQADQLLIENCYVDSNNAQHFNTSPVAGGIKITQSRGVTLRSNVVTNNIGSGIWLDESSYDMTVIGNDLTHNARMGLSIELSEDGLVANNSMVGNSFDGIRITDTGDIRVWNNSIGRNASRNVEVIQDLRRNTPSAPGHDPRQPDPDPTVPWITSSVQIVDNLFIGGGQFHVYVYDQTGKRTATQMKVTVDGNDFSAPFIQGYAPIGWDTARGVITRYYSPAAFRQATGQGSFNVMHAYLPAAAMVPAASPVPAVPLPGALATALGVPVHTERRGSF